MHPIFALGSEVVPLWKLDKLNWKRNFIEPWNETIGRGEAESGMKCSERDSKLRIISSLAWMTEVFPDSGLTKTLLIVPGSMELGCSKS